MSLVRDLKKMIDEYNPLEKSFRKVKDIVESGDPPTLSLRLFRKHSDDSRVHNTPTADEVAGLIVGDFDSSDIGRDVVVHDTFFGLTRLHETHVLFLPLQYPLVFPRGENGWQPNIPLRQTEDDKKKRTRERVTIRDFMAFRIQERMVELETLLFQKGCSNNL
jgi:hypothetical protein